MFSFQYTVPAERRTSLLSTSNPPTSSSTSSLPFQTYILPTLPFRRRHSSTSTTASSTSRISSTFSSSPTSSTVGTTSNPRRTSYLSGHISHIACALCHADLALTSQIVSKGFTGRHGRAFLVSPPRSSLLASSSASASSASSLPNTSLRAPVQRQLVTGLHTVSDITCSMCNVVLGWKYVAAEDEAQKYKVGKFILESRRVVVGSLWEEEEEEEAEDDDEESGDGGQTERMVSYEFAIGSTEKSRRLSSRRASKVDDYGAGEEGWDLAPPPPSIGGSRRLSLGYASAAENGDEEVLFDSQDSDECEDLFAGVWSPRLALARRKRKRRLNSGVGLSASSGLGSVLAEKRV